MLESPLLRRSCHFYRNLAMNHDISGQDTRV
jgi:hypothetical protein